MTTVTTAPEAEYWLQTGWMEEPGAELGIHKPITIDRKTNLHEHRITRVGHFIRKTSIDELPQLVNILKGDMSIVGPRPALPREVAQYTPYEWQRLYVTPGLSCYWQIAPHRNQLSFDEWMALDVKYVKERSFLVDWKIIFATFRAVLFGHGE